MDDHSRAVPGYTVFLGGPTALPTAFGVAAGDLAGGPGVAGVRSPSGVGQRSRQRFHHNEKVVSRFTWTATHSGPFAGIPVIGNALKVNGIVFDHFANGIMTDSRILSDEFGVLHQLGIIPAPPGA